LWGWFFVKVLCQIKRNCSWHFLPEIQRDENLISFQVVLHCGVLCTGGPSVSFWGSQERWWSKKFCLPGFGGLSLHVKMCICILRRLYEERQDISVQDPCLKRCPSPRETRCHQSLLPWIFYVEGNNPAFSNMDLSCILFSGFGMKAVVDYGDGCHLHRLQLWASSRSVG
jgi:hypothetical protein